MPSSRTRQIYPCREFEPVEIPLDLLMKSGELVIYPEAEKYFDLDYRNGRLVVAPKSYVGLIPINDNVAINVLPRFPIDNLFYFIQRSSAVLRFIDGHVRSYDLQLSEETDPIEIFATKFCSITQKTLKLGLLRRYDEVIDAAPFSGSLNISETVSLFRSKGISYRQSWHTDELTESIFENALIKSALIRVVEYLGEKRDVASKKQLASLMLLLREFDNVEALKPHFIVDEQALIRAISQLPSSHKEYSPVLWLAFLIHAKRGLAIESSGSVNFDTFVVNLAEIFENYVRCIVVEKIRNSNIGYFVKDGNIEQLSLFVNTDAYKVKPDIYITKGRVPVAVLDAKYKPSIKASDRYEVIAFCEALQVKTAIIISPHVEGESFTEIGKTASGLRFIHARINLSAENIADEESGFLARICDIITE